MSFLQRVSVDDIRSRGSIRDSDVVKLRRAFNDDANISVAEADALFDLNDACAVKDATWAEFFVEAITDYIVNQAQPEGYIVGSNADWLMQRIGVDGCVESHTELELLVHVMEVARWSPPSLASFALRQVKEAVLTGRGPLRSGHALEPGKIFAGEVELLRRILYAFGGDGNIAVTRVEADALFEINDAVASNEKSPEFTTLFVKAVANAVLNGMGMAVPSRGEALRVERENEAMDVRSGGELFVDSFSGGAAGSSARARVGGFFGRLGSGVGDVWGTYRLQSSEEQALNRLERQRLEIITSEPIDEADVAWLLSRIGRNGTFNDNERALLQYLKDESPVLPVALQEMADRVGTAA